MRKARDMHLLLAMAAEIKKRRGALEISQEELAHRADLNRSFIGKIELGQTQPSLAVVFHLADALEVDVADLVRAIAVRAERERKNRRV